MSPVASRIGANNIFLLPRLFITRPATRRVSPSIGVGGPFSAGGASGLGGAGLVAAYFARTAASDVVGPTSLRYGSAPCARNADAFPRRSLMMRSRVLSGESGSRDDMRRAPYLIKAVLS